MIFLQHIGNLLLIENHVRFRIAPDGRSLILAVSVFTDCDTLTCTKTRLDERAYRLRKR